MQISSATNVFINCPFDEPYLDMFRAVVFTVLYARCIPRCTLEGSDCGELRLNRIFRLIGECPRAIHDVSRVELDEKTELPRFNMPFELGLFFGAKYFGGQSCPERPCLIFQKKPHDHDLCLSDISGCDPVAHKNSVRTMIRRVWAWLRPGPVADEEKSAQAVYELYRLFDKDFETFCRARGDSYLRMPYEHYVHFTMNVSEWLRDNLPR